MHERARTPDRVDAPDEAAQPLERVGILQLRRAPTLAREERETESLMGLQGALVEGERGYHGNLFLGELGGEAVLLQDLLVRPAPRAIELRDDGDGLLDAHLVDAILVAVQRELATVAQQPHALHRVQDDVG